MKAGPFFILLLLLIIRLSRAAQAPKQTPAFEKNQLFRDFFHLTRANFSASVLQSRMAWVVFFHEGMLDRSWKRAAASLRGIVRFGMLHRKQEPQLLQELKLAKGTVARVYPYGGKLVKKKFLEDCRNALDAVKKAESSIPNKIIGLEEGGGLEGFLLDSFMQSPTRLPVLMLTKESSPSSLFCALALRFERFINFRIVSKPASDQLRRLGLPPSVPVPGLVALVTENFQDPKRRKFFAVPITKSSTEGELSYADALIFVFQVNRRFRHTLPGDNGASDPRIVRAEEALTVEREVFDIHEDLFSLVDPKGTPATPSKQEL